MKLIRANQASEKLIDKFLKNNEEINKHTLMESGYVVEINNRITGCFNLELIDDGLYWLKQLYITRSDAIKLPVLVETILALAKQKKAKKVFVKSHKLMLDIILNSLQFQIEEVSPIDNQGATTQEENEKWWSFHVS